MCNNDAVPYSGIRPAISQPRTEKKIAGLRSFGVRFLQAVNAGGDVKEYGADLADGRVPQLASIPKTKRQAVLRPTHNGSDKVSERAKFRATGGWSIPQQRRRPGPTPAYYTKLACCL